MKVTKLSPKQLLIEFPTRKEMNLTCFRMSEFSEGYEELRTYYTPDIFIDKWSDENGKITYWEYWEGHNITRKKIVEFYKDFGCYNDIHPTGYRKHIFSEREDAILNELDQIDSDGHVIFCVEGDKMTLKHELAHSYYFLYPEYKVRADSIVNGLNYVEHYDYTKGAYCDSDINVELEISLGVLDKIKDGLRKMKYSDEVIQDEMQAYLTAYDQEEWDKCFPNVKLSEVLDATILLNQLYDYFTPTNDARDYKSN